MCCPKGFAIHCKACYYSAFTLTGVWDPGNSWLDLNPLSLSPFEIATQAHFVALIRETLKPCVVLGWGDYLSVFTKNKYGTVNFRFKQMFFFNPRLVGLGSFSEKEHFFGHIHYICGVSGVMKRGKKKKVKDKHKGLICAFPLSSYPLALLFQHGTKTMPVSLHDSLHV